MTPHQSEFIKAYKNTKGIKMQDELVNHQSQKQHPRQSTTMHEQQQQQQKVNLLIWT